MPNELLNEREKINLQQKKKSKLWWIKMKRTKKQKTYNELKLSRPWKTPVIKSSIKLLRSFNIVKAVKLLNVAYWRFARNSLPFNELAIFAYFFFVLFVCYLQFQIHIKSGTKYMKEKSMKIKKKKTKEGKNEMKWKE